MFETLGHVIQGVGRKQKETNMECISKNKQQAMNQERAKYQVTNQQQKKDSPGRGNDIIRDTQEGKDLSFIKKTGQY